MKYTTEYRDWKRDGNWYIDPKTGNRIIFGEDVLVGKQVKLGNGVTIGDNAIIGSEVQIEDRVQIGDFAEIKDGVAIGDDTILGDNVTVGSHAKLGKLVRIENGVSVGDDAAIGDGARIGRYTSLGDRVKISKYVAIGSMISIEDDITSQMLNESFRKMYKNSADEHVFWVWVTPERTLPIEEDSDRERTNVKFEKGAIIEMPEAQVSDQLYDTGIQVLRPGYRPEWACVTGSKHNLIQLRVKVRSEDILFAGMPGEDVKLRVRRIEVLD